MLTVPTAPRRSQRAIFWLSLCLLIGLLAALVGWLLARDLGLTLAALVISGLMLVGFFRPQFVYVALHGWNQIARTIGSGARFLLTAICYFIMFSVIGRGGSRLPIHGDSEKKSQWHARGTLKPSHYASQFDFRGSRPPTRSWARGYLSWAYKSGNLWALSLFPFLLLLSLLEEEEDTRFPANIYTLF